MMQTSSVHSTNSSGKKTNIVPISPSKKMLENSNSKNRFSNLDRLTFRNTRPVFLGLGTIRGMVKK